MQLERMQSENIASGTPRGHLAEVEERGKRGGGEGGSEGILWRGMDGGGIEEKGCLQVCKR